MDKQYVWILGGNDDDGNDDIYVYSTYGKARQALTECIHDIIDNYGKDCVKERTNNYFFYDAGNHYGNLWIAKQEVR